MARTLLRLGLVALLSLNAAGSALGAVARLRVYIVLVDGLDARHIGPELTPTLWSLAHTDRAAFYPHAQSVMPTVTNTNHASVMTAAYAAAHGIVGNLLWLPGGDEGPAASERAALLEVETLFTVAERERPKLVTAGLFGKSRLVQLFVETERQRRPDVLWGDPRTETEPADAQLGFGSDARTMDQVLVTIAEHDPDLLFAALPDVDRTSHVFGPESAQARRAILTADQEIGRLVEFAKRRASWDGTVLFVTADHGLESTKPDPGRGPRYPLILFGRELERAGLRGVQLVSNGAVELVALRGERRRALDGNDARLLAQVRALALEQPEIAEAWYRLPNPADGAEAFTLAAARPQWRMAHPRAGELVLVAKPNHAFSDPFAPAAAGLLGQHGAPAQADIPIVVTGGTRVRPATTFDDPSTSAANPDIGATVAWLLDLRRPRRIDGTAVPRDLAGRVLREAFE